MAAVIAATTLAACGGENAQTTPDAPEAAETSAQTSPSSVAEDQPSTLSGGGDSERLPTTPYSLSVMSDTAVPSQIAIAECPFLPQSAAEQVGPAVQTGVLIRMRVGPDGCAWRLFDEAGEDLEAKLQIAITPLPAAERLEDIARSEVRPDPGGPGETPHLIVNVLGMTDGYYFRSGGRLVEISSFALLGTEDQMRAAARAVAENLDAAPVAEARHPLAQETDPCDLLPEDAVRTLLAGEDEPTAFARSVRRGCTYSISFRRGQRYSRELRTYFAAATEAERADFAAVAEKVAGAPVIARTFEEEYWTTEDARALKNGYVINVQLTLRNVGEARQTLSETERSNFRAIIQNLVERGQE
ncbi:MAG: hypothetical protein AAGH48_01515 [Pseudomonadota bacterium]